MRKKDEIRKREQLLRASFLAPSGFRNFVIPSKIDRAGKFGNIVQAKQEMGMTREQQQEAKRSFLSSVQRSIAFEGLSHSQLCDKIRYFHQRVSKLEASKYDLEIRHERQEYDVHF
ncbi:unnamed protein product [Toxocara canis]|uniref:Uncharacterized protein n=1 Tax=Toxocara canis TaxID=6265 RepID=A0A183UPB8_TOXCA|nr:unnamed protein product [Toxocara canis]